MRFLLLEKSHRAHSHGMLYVLGSSTLLLFLVV